MYALQFACLDIMAFQNLMTFFNTTVCPGMFTFQITQFDRISVSGLEHQVTIKYQSLL